MLCHWRFPLVHLPHHCHEVLKVKVKFGTYNKRFLGGNSSFFIAFEKKEKKNQKKGGGGRKIGARRNVEKKRGIESVEQ